MTKKEQETYVKLALNEIETACRDAKEAAIKYGAGDENYSFEVGFFMELKTIRYNMSGKWKMKMDMCLQFMIGKNTDNTQMMM